jgi:hypothetical protein
MMKINNCNCKLFQDYYTGDFESWTDILTSGRTPQ